MIFSFGLSAQTDTNRRFFNYHFQETIISQYHPIFSSLYSGENSLQSNAETATSYSTTLFLGFKLWKNGSFYFNPELSGGTGFSSTRGVAGFPNGEVYRVSDPLPHIFIARLYYRQLFSLSDKYEQQTDDANQLPVKVPEKYISLTIGKFSLLDFFDNNYYSHDPRTQFFNWALMGNGAWDYPANTRGYNYGFTTEYITPNFALRYAFVMMPVTANGSVMDQNILKANGQALEAEKNYTIGTKKGNIHLLGFFNMANMGNYKEAILWGKKNDTIPIITKTRLTGRTKFGYGINVSQELGKNIGMFFRSSWNDGRNETWAFTEIDHSASLGFVIDGKLWKRNEDNIGIAFLINGLSEDHKNYLKAGGYGFIIGDENLNYAPEMIAEFMYLFKLKKYPLQITPDYQFVINPAYNKDRGPVHVFGARVHIAM